MGIIDDVAMDTVQPMEEGTRTLSPARILFEEVDRYADGSPRRCAAGAGETAGPCEVESVPDPGG